MRRHRSARRPLSPATAIVPLAAAGVLGLTLLAAAGCGAPPPPNIVLVVIDTARADHFSSYGYARRTTPHVDALARGGVRFSRARATGPWTLPSHGSIFTGLPPSEHGLHWRPDARPEEWPTQARLTTPGRARLLTAALRRQGYATFAVVNNPWLAGSGLAGGFDEFLDLSRPRRLRRIARERLEIAGGEGPLERRGAEISRRLFEAWLDERAPEGPFFAFFNLMEPHFPYLPRPGVAGRFGGRPRLVRQLLRDHARPELAMLGGTLRPDPEGLADLYDEELAAVDRELGELVSGLKRRGLYDPALIVVTSDHGELLGEGGRYSHQLSLDPVLLHVPLILKLPGGAGAGTVVDDPRVSLADLHVTLLAAAHGGRSPFPVSRWSQDLARMDRFERLWTLSESHYSPAYLEQIRRVTAGAFDPAPHRVVRRVVFVDGRSHELRASAAHELPADLASASPPLPPQVLGELIPWIRGLGRSREEGAAGRVEAEVEAALRELGYVE